MNLISLIKNLLFKKEIKALNKLIKEATALSEANEFFIRHGMEVCRFQLNNPKLPIPRTLMGHGLPIAAKHLGLKSLAWERSLKNESYKWAQSMVKKDGIAVHVGKRVFKSYVAKPEEK